MAPKSQTILTVLQGIYRYVKKNVGGLISAVWGPYFRLAVFFRPVEKSGGLISGWGDFFRVTQPPEKRTPENPFFRNPRKKELRKKDRNAIFALFSGVIFSGGLFTFGLFSADGGGGCVGCWGYGGCVFVL